MVDVLEKLAEKNNAAQGDYVENGILICGKCHTPKQTRKAVPVADGRVAERTLPIMCECEQAKEARKSEEERREKFRAELEEIDAKYPISDGRFRRETFGGDDRMERKISDVCRRYVDSWGDMCADNIGILFHGTVGTGKTFYASAIANGLIEQCVPATVTSFTRLLNMLQGARDRLGAIDHLQKYKLLVLDDLGVERDSQYALEQVYTVIDARVRSGLPVVITTNLSLDEIKNPESMQLARIYDRVLDACPITLKMVGESRRAGNADSRRAKARELLSEK